MHKKTILNSSFFYIESEEGLSSLTNILHLILCSLIVTMPVNKTTSLFGKLLNIMIFEYIKQCLFFFRLNFSSLAIINLPFIAISYFALEQIGLAEANQSPEVLANKLLTLSAFNLLIMPIYWGATIVFMQSTVEGPTYSPGQAVIASIKIWYKLFLVFLLYSLCISFGFMAFIIPGIYIAIRLSIADYLCVIEKQSVFQSLKLSWLQTKDYVWPIFQGVAIILIAIVLLRSVLMAILVSLFNDQGIISMIAKITFDLLNMLVLIYGFRMYCLIKKTL